MEYSYKITKVYTDGKGEIRKVNATVTGVDAQGYSASIDITGITDPALELIPLEQLTEEQVVGWIKDKYSTEIESNLTQKVLENYLNSLEGVELPWS